MRLSSLFLALLLATPLATPFARTPMAAAVEKVAQPAAADPGDPCSGAEPSTTLCGRLRVPGG